MKCISRLLAVLFFMVLSHGLICSPTAGAQKTTESDGVPKELLLSLLGDFGQKEEASDILVGKAPKWFPNDLILPSDARVLGTRVRSETQARVIVVTSRPPEALVSEYRRTLSRRGWTISDNSRDQGGFVHTRSLRTAVLCGEDTSLTVRAFKNTRTHLRLSYDTDLSEDNVCEREGRRRAPGMSLELPIPILMPPEGVETVGMSHGSGSGSSERGWEVRAVRAESALGASEIAARYGTQIRKQGWTLQQRRGVEGVAAWSWRLDKESGEHWNGLFTVTTLPDSKGQEHQLRFETWGPDTSE